MFYLDLDPTNTWFIYGFIVPFFTVIYLHLLLNCLLSALEALDSLRSAGSFRRFEYKVEHKEVADSAGGKSDSLNIFFKNGLTSQSLLLAETKRFHFPPPALKTGRRT